MQLTVDLIIPISNGQTPRELFNKQSPSRGQAIITVHTSQPL